MYTINNNSSILILGEIFLALHKKKRNKTVHVTNTCTCTKTNYVAVFQSEKEAPKTSRHFIVQTDTDVCLPLPGLHRFVWPFCWRSSPHQKSWFDICGDVRNRRHKQWPAREDVNEVDYLHQHSFLKSVWKWTETHECLHCAKYKNKQSWNDSNYAVVISGVHRSTLIVYCRPYDR